MFIRKNKNRSGTVSIQIVEKVNRSNRVVKRVGVASTAKEEEFLMLLAKSQLEQIQGTRSLFVEHDDLVVENFINTLSTSDLQVVGPELILARIYQKIGYPDDGSCSYFKALVLSRLVYPGSKLKTTEYFQKHLNLRVSVYTIYRFLDELSSTLKTQIEELTFAHTRSLWPIPPFCRNTISMLCGPVVMSIFWGQDSRTSPIRSKPKSLMVA